MIKRVILGVLIGFSVSCGRPSSHRLTRGRIQIDFSTLTASDTVKIEMRSTGCFHGYSRSFQIQGGPPPVLSVMKSNVVANSKRLSGKDVKQLNNLVKYYNAKPSGWCSTVERVDIVLYRNDELVSSNTVVDSTCASSSDKRFSTVEELARKHGLIKR